MEPSNEVLPSSAASVTEWLQRLKAGDSAAGGQLWGRYVERLVRLASRKLGDAPKKVADEEDVVLSAFHAFLRGVSDRRFARLDDRDDLWQVLVMLTERKAIGVRRWEQAEKRATGDVQGESAIDGQGSGAPGIQHIADAEPTPEFAVEMADALEQRMATLRGQPELQRIACDKLAGHTNDEIAQRQGWSLRSVERRLRLIRTIWNKDRKS
jgi:DNA-directed RNA polymerase specialized sigma24 family protein